MLRCRTADFVEPDMNWEAEEYERAGIDFRAFSLVDEDIDTVVAHIGDAHVLVVDRTPVTAQLIERLPDVRLIIRHGDGYDNVAVAAATASGIAVANKPGFWSTEAAEHAMVLTLVVASHLPLQQAIAARNGQDPQMPWDRTRIYPIPRLRGRTVGVLGFGRTGSHYARLMHTLGCPVIVHDHRKPPEEIRAAGYYPVGFPTLLKEADVLSLHVPATEKTNGLIDATALASMKKDAILINIARGTIVNTDALTSALEKNHLRGAGLDVTEPEPLPPNHPLLSNPNVVVTPHLAWYSDEAMWAMRRSIVEDVMNLAEGIMPATVVNPEVFQGNRQRNAISLA